MSTTTRLIIPAKEAADAAVEYVRHLGPIFPFFQSARLEEIEFLDERPEWDITISFGLGFTGSDRITKRFRVDAVTGAVLSMKNRPAD